MAVHIASECNVAKVGEAPCPLFGVVIQPRTSVDNQDSWSLFDGHVVPGKHAGQGLAVVVVIDCGCVNGQCIFLLWGIWYATPYAKPGR